MSKKVVLMAVSSSGGHIYPALALSQKLEEAFIKKQKEDSLEIHIVHGDSKLVRQILKPYSYRCHQISVGGLAKNPQSNRLQNGLRKVKTFIQLPLSFFKALFIIYKIKAHVILGTGGSVTFPVLVAGFIMRKKIAIWEANTSMGLANKFLIPFTSCVFTVFPKVQNLNSKKQVWSSYPLRKKIQQSKSTHLSSENMQQNQTYDSKKLFPKNKFKVLVLGGSQGSVFFNQVVSQALESENWRQDIFIYHQTGERSFKWVSKKYESLQGVFAFSFTQEIQKYYQECDLIFSRAGSGCIAEIAFLKKALVLVPLTYSAAGHQLKNALGLSKNNCVEMILEQHFNSELFKKKTLELKSNLKKRTELGVRLKQVQKEEDKITPWILKSLSE